MKKIIGIVVALTLVLSLMFAFAAPVSAAGAVKVNWNFSGAVMPVPPYGPYGLSDIAGSNTSSKLIVNQPNGAVVANMTGDMNGLAPNTLYTVFLSNGYTKYTPVDVRGTYTWLVLGTYAHDMVITTQNPDGTFSGYGGYPEGGPYTETETITGQVSGDAVTITFTTTYTPGPYSVTVSGTIATDGSMSGTSPWEWHTTSGNAKVASGSKGWPGLFTSTIQPFTFMTDGFGAGSWHVNMRAADFPGKGTYKLSVWINGPGGTILISDPFSFTIK